MAATTSISRIEFRSFGPVLVTRDQGEPVRHELIRLIQSSDIVEIDLSGVEAFTPSFMDEVLGKCLEQVGKDSFRAKVRLFATEPEVRKLVNLVLTNRAVREKQQRPT